MYDYVLIKAINNLLSNDHTGALVEGDDVVSVPRAAVWR